jgi:hypothetical protein
MKTIFKKAPQYITDKDGKKISVVLPFSHYKKLIEELEELDDIRLYDSVKARKERTIPFSKYVQRRSKKHA